MAIAVVQRKVATDNGGAAGSIAPAFTSNVTAGSMIVVAVSMNDSTAVLHAQEQRPPTDTRGNKFYLIQPAIFNATPTVGLRIYAAYNSTAGADTVTVSDNNNEGQANVYEISGVASYGAFDKKTAQTLAATTAYTSGATAATAFANEIAIGAFASAVAGSVFAAGGSYVNLQNNPGTSDVLATEELIVSATGAQTATATAASSTAGIAAIATFADTASVTPVGVIAVLGTTFNTTSGTHTVVATPTASDLIVIIRAATGSTVSTAPTDNNADGLGAYTLATSGLRNTSADILEIWVRNGLVGSATSTTFSEAPGVTTGGGLTVYRLTGFSKAGSSAIKQSAKQENQAANGVPTPTFASGVTSPNPVIAACANATAVTSNTHLPVGFVQGQINTYATPTSTLISGFSEGGQTGTAMTFDAQSSSVWGSAAVELDSSSAAVTSSHLFPLLGVGA